MPEPKLIQLTAKGQDAEVELWCDALASDGFSLVLVSAAGPQMAVAAAIAGLRNAGSMRYRPHRLPRLVADYNYSHALGALQGGYDVRKTPIGYDLWHFVAIARRANLLIEDSPEALWRILKNPPYTTPLLREWIGEIEPQLRRDNRLNKLRSFGCDAAELRVGNDQLDQIVSDGLRRGRMKIR